MAQHLRLEAGLELDAVDDDQIAQPHGFHRPRRRTDVAGRGGFDKDDRDIGQVRQCAEGQDWFWMCFVWFTHD